MVSEGADRRGECGGGDGGSPRRAEEDEGGDGSDEVGDGSAASSQLGDV